MIKTFKQFLDEDEKKTMSFQDLLHGPCSYFFKQSQKKGLLVRGVNGHGDYQGILTIGDPAFDAATMPYFLRTVRKDRKPMDTAKIIHDIIDDWFEEEMGFRARSQSVFCFGEAARKAAAEYGAPSVILPIGSFHYVWSPRIADLYDDVIMKQLQKSQTMGAAATLRSDWYGSDGKPDLEKIHELLDGLGYTINNLSDAVQDSVEIMIECDQYYVIPYDSETQLEKIKKAFVHA